MRMLLALFTIIGFGTLALTAVDAEVAPATGLTLATASETEETAVDILTQVDREDDTPELLPCTPAPNDCTLRSALAIANSDAQPTTITFADHYLINLQAPLPPLTEDETTITAAVGQEVHVNGNQLPGSVFYILGRGVRIEGLYLYAPGPGYATLTVSGTAYNVVILRNVIGDDDAPAGNCGRSEGAYAGILVDAHAEQADVIHAYIAQNIIECHRGTPGTGIQVATDRVVIGYSDQGCNPEQGQNVIQFNSGPAVNLGNHTGSTVCYNLMHDNGGSFIVDNFNNNLIHNDIQ